MSTTLDRTPADDAAVPTRSGRRAGKALLAGGAALALLMGGGTMAALSDFELVPNNRIGVATLELDLVGATGGGTCAVVPFNNLTLLPGDTIEWAGVATIRGEVPSSRLSASIVNLSGTEDGCKGAEATVNPSCTDTAGQGQLRDAATVRVTAVPLTSTGRCQGGDFGTSQQTVLNRPTLYPGVGTTVASGNRVTVSNAALPAAQAQGVTPFTLPSTAGAGAPVSFAPNDRVCVGVVVTVPERGAQDNELQGDKASFDVRFDLTQNPRS